jgi:hypothetical protein
MRDSEPCLDWYGVENAVGHILEFIFLYETVNFRAFQRV